ncbi:hypothetical protein BDN71DRAFT_1426727 [Pleurotus eryngii]|uniref:Uncharacterized protein n=1 Tax=Pleurotus eryngii TaxID=5323 RepID=A0A9P6A6L7_PLEER|nr:hypothetical protein BDN71DRAFT_1426727 [Pleurotus eryngii]
MAIHPLPSLYDVGNMRDGDRAGLALFRDASAWICVARTGSNYAIRFVNDLTIGTQLAEGLQLLPPVSQGGQYTSALMRPLPRAVAITTGSTFTSMGSFTMITAWQHYMVYGFRLFNYATLATGGTVKVNYFDIQGRIHSSVPVITSSCSAPTPTGGSGTVARHGQCGGNGYSGPTAVITESNL